MTVTHTQQLSPYHRSPGAWRRRSSLELGALPTAAGCARGHVGNVLREWRIKEFSEATEIVVSELMTNAVCATRKASLAVPQPVRLWLFGGASAVLVHVWDAIAEAPAPREASELDESGRGLLIVAAYAAAWGSYPVREGGKVTWALIGPPVTEVR